MLGIKSQLFKFANHVNDQLWLKRGSPDRISIVEIELDCDKSSYLRDIIYGKYNDNKDDGIHLMGNHSTRNFTYRAVQVISHIIKKPFHYQQKTVFSRRNFRAAENRRDQDNHSDCPQAQFKRQSASNGHGGKNSEMSYSDAVKNTEGGFSVPTKNFWNPLNC